VKLTKLTIAAFVLTVAVSAVHAQGTWEGPTGVFLNPLAIDLAQTKTQVSAHYLNLQPVGGLSTFGVTYGAAKNLEVGLTYADLSAGAQTQFEILHAKWIAVPFKGEGPAIALGGIYRNAEGGKSTSDFYAAITKVFPAKTPVIASLTLRNTDGVGSGLFGRDTERSFQVGGFLGVQALPNLIAGVEYYGQPATDDWKDLAVRYIVDPNTFIDAGLARINKTFSDQLAVAVTHQF